jgi:hypothetical protein
MAQKSKILLSLGAALASLTGLSIQGAEAKAVVVNDADAAASQNTAAKLQANAHYQVGEDLLGFVTTKQADGPSSPKATRRMPHMRPMPQAAKLPAASRVEVT